MDSVSHQRQLPIASTPHGRALPSIASLTSNLPPSEQSPIRHSQHAEARDARDSGNWSISQGPSKHSSTVSNNTMGLQLQTILNTEDSPSRSSVVEVPSSYKYASGLHQVQARDRDQPNALPPLTQAFDNRHSLDVASHFDSRRSSVDSRMNAGMNHLAISPCSLYDSQNASRVSLVSNLQQQRGITNTEPRPNGVSPLSPMGRNNSRAVPPPRRAPVINPNPRNVSGMPDPMAAAPTKGFPWAFPAEFDPEDRRASSSDIPTTHHHSMQHRSITSLQNVALADAASPGGGNYSRTPELRISHKMAERKRRSEMKNLFDELNNILPNSPGSKSSKWEVLTKSIEYIKSLGRSHDQARAELARLRPEADFGRRAQEENDMLRNELASVWNALRRVDPGNPHVHGSMTSMLAQQHAGTSGSANNVLPPLQQQQLGQSQHQAPQWSAPASTAMQGVEYGGARPYEHSHR